MSGVCLQTFGNDVNYIIRKMYNIIIIMKKHDVCDGKCEKCVCAPYTNESCGRDGFDDGARDVHSLYLYSTSKNIV